MLERAIFISSFSGYVCMLHANQREVIYTSVDIRRLETLA
jgi:hypothetical protein